MISIGDALLKIGVDKSEVDQGLQSMGVQVKDALRVMGASFAAVSVGGLKMDSSIRKWNSSLAGTGITLGMTTSQMRSLVLQVTDVGLSITETAATFEELARAGVRNTTTLLSATKAFDALAHATGMSADEVATMMIPALKALGESLPTTSKDLDTFTWLVKNTTVDLSDFASAMNYVALYGDKLSVTSKDMAAMLAILASRGIQGTAATRRFRTAVTEANTTGKDLNTILGITQDELDTYTKKIDGATGITEDYAKAAETQYGIMDKIKQKYDEIVLRMSDFIKVAEPALVALGLLGGAMLLYSTAAGKATIAMAAQIVLHPIATARLLAMAAATGVMTAAQWALNIAVEANPIGVMIVTIGLLIAAGIALWKNWDKVAQFFKNILHEMKMWFLDTVWVVLSGLSAIAGWIPGLGAKIKAAKNAISNMMDTEEITHDAQLASRAIKSVADEIANLDDQATQAGTDFDKAVESINADYGIIEEKAAETRRQIAQDESDAEIALAQKTYDAKVALLDKETNATVRALQSQIDVLDEKDSADQEATLRKAVADAWSRKDKVTAQQALDDFLGQKQKDFLQKQIRDVQDSAQAQKDEWKTNLDLQLDALANALVTKLANIETERVAAIQAQQDILDATLTRIELEKRAESLKDVNPAIAPLIESAPSPASVLNNRLSLAAFAGGGIITQPTLLSSLKTGRPYGVMAEKGPEAIGAAGGNLTINIAELHVREDADVNRIAAELHRIRMLRGSFGSAY